MSYVVSGLLPQVTRHLPPGLAPDGAVTAAGATLPVVCEPIVSADWTSARRYYVAYAQGEPACYWTPAAWRRLVRQRRAVIVAGAHLTPRREVAA